MEDKAEFAQNYNNSLDFLRIGPIIREFPNLITSVRTQLMNESFLVFIFRNYLTTDGYFPLIVSVHCCVFPYSRTLVLECVLRGITA